MRRFLHLFALVFLLTIGAAQAENINFETLTRKDGLSHSLITNIIQDHTGYMWYGTQDGLLRYDGYKFKVFKPNKEDPKSIQSSWVTELLVDRKNQLWVRFRNGGISMYNPTSEDFMNFNHDPDDSTTISNDLSPYQTYTEQKSMQETPDGNVWMCTMNGLNKIDINSLKVTRYYKSANGLSDQITTCLFLEGKDKLWIGTTKGLNLLDLKTNKITQIKEHLHSKQITVLLKDSQNTYWAGTKANGLYRFTMDQSLNFTSFKGILTGKNQVEHIRNQGVLSLIIANDGDIYLGMHQGLFQLDQQGKVIKNITEGYSMPTIGRMIQDQQGNIWAGGSTDHVGIYKYEPHNDQLMEFDENQLQSNGFSSNKITSIYQSKGGVLWIGTSKGGLMKCNLHGRAFLRYGPSHFPDFDHMVHAIYKQDNRIYVGTQLSFDIFDTNFKLIKRYKRGKGADAVPASVVGVFGTPVKNDKLWVGYFEGKVSEFNIKTGKFHHYNIHLPEDSSKFSPWSPRSILTTSAGDTYFASITGGIMVKKNGQNYFQNLKALVKNPDHVKSSNYAFMEASDGKIWIGSVKEGIYIYDPKEYRITPFVYNDQGLSSHEIKEMYEAQNGEIWIATRYGLNRYSPLNQTIKSYLVKDGLPSNILHGILEDRKGNIWVSTNNGISRLDVNSNRFVNFYEEDGLLSNEFNERAFFKDQDGMFYFGDRMGIVKFNPNSISIDTSSPRTYISGFEINGEDNNGQSTISRSELNNKLNANQEIDLPYNFNNFAVSVSTLDFRAPQKIRYRYRLKGLDKHWNYTAHGENTIKYPFLEPGDYTLQMEASNPDGIWSGKIKENRVIISPPWYQSAWFKTLLTLIAFGTMAAFIIIYIHLIKKSKRHLEKTVKERTAELKEVNSELLAVNEELQTQQEVVINQNTELQNRQQELRQQKRNIELMAKMGRKITSSVELNRVFGEIYSNISELVDIDEMMIGQVNEKTGQLELWGVRGDVNELIKDQIDLKSEARLSAYVVRSNQYIFSNDLRVDTQNLLRYPDRKYEQKESSGVYLPLNFRNDKPLGVLVAISNKLNAFTQTDLSLLSNLASYASIAITNASAYEKLYFQSEQLKNIDKIKTDFYTNVSHEFRTPLTLIQGPVEELLHSEAIAVPDRNLLKIISRNSKLLLSLVEQIMELSRIDGGAIAFKEKKNNLGHHFETIYDSFKHLALQKRIEIIFNSTLEGLTAKYDLDVVNKIIYNLLNNSIKYTKEGGLIIFTAKMANDGLEVSISDNGDGIPEQKIDQIFNRFYRLSENDEDAIGSGIGLSIVKQLIEKMGGDISVESKYKDQFDDHGTTFTVNIPVLLSDEEVVDTPEANSQLTPVIANNEVLKMADNITKPKVMIVEDNADLRYFLYSQLEKFYFVVEAKNGVEALKLIEKEPPHLIISDIMMPEMDGISLCRRVKENEKTCHIPIILITAKDAEQDKIVGLEAGASDYITKPFKAEELFLKAKNYLNQRLSMIDHSNKSIFEEGITPLNDANPKDQEFINNIKALIEDNIENSALGIDFFCENLGVSRSWLYSKMKSLLGVSMNEFVRQCRLNLAAKILVSQKLSTAQVAYSVGFNDPKYFARCFKKEFGVGPKQYLSAKLEATIN
ncbi:hybrid sensor histidine kinase/response regulator transcription factor [Persicobacter psychrovividus]|uniref:histidine kinase n=1 Tax=Persicobacter psychrovividus TaxID=387638 RepID=A0ABN6LGG4_9BACT|nr:hypothetical protein PEPS_42090 [Persicobacter psychrovividus]